MFKSLSGMHTGDSIVCQALHEVYTRTLWIFKWSGTAGTASSLQEAAAGQLYNYTKLEGAHQRQQHATDQGADSPLTPANHDV